MQNCVHPKGGKVSHSRDANNLHWDRRTEKPGFYEVFRHDPGGRPHQIVQDYDRWGPTQSQPAKTA